MITDHNLFSRPVLRGEGDVYRNKWIKQQSFFPDLEPNLAIIIVVRNKPIKYKTQCIVIFCETRTVNDLTASGGANKENVRVGL